MPKPVKASCASEAVQLDASRKTRDLGLNGLGLRLEGAGVLEPFGRGSNLWKLWDANRRTSNCWDTYTP